jgi:hypothetical protein
MESTGLINLTPLWDNKINITLIGSIWLHGGFVGTWRRPGNSYPRIEALEDHHAETTRNDPGEGARPK